MPDGYFYCYLIAFLTFESLFFIELAARYPSVQFVYPVFHILGNIFPVHSLRGQILQFDAFAYDHNPLFPMQIYGTDGDLFAVFFKIAFRNQRKPRKEMGCLVHIAAV